MSDVVAHSSLFSMSRILAIQFNPNASLKKSIIRHKIVTREFMLVPLINLLPAPLGYLVRRSLSTGTLHYDMRLSSCSKLRIQSSSVSRHI